jgi:hypothetical protein
MGADVVDVVTCMYLDSSTKEAKGVSTEFLTTTPEVYVRVALTGVTPGYAMWIVWYEPDGAEWYPELIAVTSDTVYWASLEIDSLVRARTGIWKVTVYYGEESENVEEIASVNFKIVDYQKIIDDFNSTLNYYADQLDVLSDENTGLLDQIETLSDEILPLQSQIISLQSQITSLNATYISVNADLLSTQSLYADLNQTYQEALSDLKIAEDKLEEAQASQGPSQTLFYIAIAAAALGILAAAYFAMKARG